MNAGVRGPRRQNPVLAESIMLVQATDVTDRLDGKDDAERFRSMILVVMLGRTGWRWGACHIGKPCIALIPQPLRPIVGEGEQNRQRLSPTLGRKI